MRNVKEKRKKNKNNIKEEMDNMGILQIAQGQCGDFSVFLEQNGHFMVGFKKGHRKTVIPSRS
jgi:hypothetical protein